jgi:Leu/Phe-tRNA-protein transferase
VKNLVFADFFDEHLIMAADCQVTDSHYNKEKGKKSVERKAYR